MAVQGVEGGAPILAHEDIERAAKRLGKTLPLPGRRELEPVERVFDQVLWRDPFQHHAWLDPHFRQRIVLFVPEK